MNYCQFRNETIKRMANAGGGLLPAEYQQVEYLQSVSPDLDGNDRNIRINTGINYFADFEIECEKTDTRPVKYIGIARNTCVQRNNANSPFYSFYNNDNSYYVSNVNVYSRAVVSWKNNKIYINGNYIRDFAKTNATGSLALYGAGGYYYNAVRIYYCKLWDTNSDLTRHYIPCYRKSDNTPGMYDLVTDTFNPGTGTGSFIVGPDV